MTLRLTIGHFKMFIAWWIGACMAYIYFVEANATSIALLIMFVLGHSYLVGKDTTIPAGFSIERREITDDK